MRRAAVMIVAGLALASSPVICGDAADVVVIVSHGSQVDALTRNEITDIFLGRMNRLPNGEPIEPIDQEEGARSREAFYGQIVGRSSAQIRAYWSRITFTGRGRPPRAAPDGVAVRNFVAENRHAIGYIAPELVDASVAVVTIDP